MTKVMKMNISTLTIEAIGYDIVSFVYFLHCKKMANGNKSTCNFTT